MLQELRSGRFPLHPGFACFRSGNCAAMRIVAAERQAERADDLFYQSVRNPRRA
jgi:hypothetical protein